MALAQEDLTVTRQTFPSLNPATDEVLAEYPIDGATEVRAAVQRARESAAWWSDLGFDERKRRLRAWKGIIARRAGELSELIHRENGKPTADAFLEIVLVLDHLEWAARNAGKVLGPHRVPAGITMLNHAASVEYPPLGVVGVIGLASTMSTNILDRTREFGVMHAIGARPKTVRRIVVAEGIFLALASCLVAAIPTLGLTAVLGAGLGNLFFSAPLPFRISTVAVVIWITVVILGSLLATEAAATRASRLTVREALAYL